MATEETNSAVNMSLHHFLSDMRGSVFSQVEGDLNNVIMEVSATTVVRGMGCCWGVVIGPIDLF